MLDNLFQQVSAFMTHFGNYGNDRLAIYTFEGLADFISRWTNLKMVTTLPQEMAQKYFELWPGDVFPIWLVRSVIIMIIIVIHMQDKPLQYM